MKRPAFALLALTAAYCSYTAEITHVITLEPVYTLPFTLSSSVELQNSLTDSSDLFLRFSTQPKEFSPFPWMLTEVGVSCTAKPIQSFEQDLLVRCALAFGTYGRMRLSVGIELSRKTPPYARIVSLLFSTSPPDRRDADLSATVLLVVSRQLGFSCTATLSLTSFREPASPLPAEISTGFSVDLQSSLVRGDTARHAGVRFSFLPGLVIPSVIYSWNWSPGKSGRSDNS